MDVALYLSSKTSVGRVSYVVRHVSQSFVVLFLNMALCHMCDTWGRGSKIVNNWIEHSIIFGQFSWFCLHMRFGFLNFGTVIMFLYFGRLNCRIHIQLHYYVWHIWTFNLSLILQFFKIFIIKIKKYTCSYQEWTLHTCSLHLFVNYHTRNYTVSLHTRYPMSYIHITSNFVFTRTLLSIVNYRFHDYLSLVFHIYPVLFFQITLS